MKKVRVEYALKGRKSCKIYFTLDGGFVVRISTVEDIANRGHKPFKDLKVDNWDKEIDGLIADWNTPLISAWVKARASELKRSP